MSDHPVQTTVDSLCKLVRWAHSHGTICNLIPNLQHHGNLLTDGPHGNLSAAWGCSAGHAYRWPFGYYDSRNNSNSAHQSCQRPDRFVGRPANKVASARSYDQSFSDPSEGEELSSHLFDIAGCDSSATDEDGDYEPHPPKRRGAHGSGSGVAKKIKKETAEGVYKQETGDDYYTIANSHVTYTNCGGDGAVPALDSIAGSQTSQSPLITRLPEPLETDSSHKPTSLSCEILIDPELEEAGGSSTKGTTDQALGCSFILGTTEQAPRRSCTTGTIEQTLKGSSITGTTEKTAGQGEMEHLRALLHAERSRSEQMTETISSLKQDKELLQHELTKKAELICDFLQDQLRPEKRGPHPSNQMAPGSSHTAYPEDAIAFDAPVLFDSFEEVEIHPVERHRDLKTKRNRDGENTRVRMKNVVGVIARYMAALQEFRRSVSMKVAFDRVGVDRNTISRTAAIAELSLAAPEVFHSLAPWDEKEETLAHYAHRCRQAMDDNIRAKIKSMKAKGDLLPIVSKGDLLPIVSKGDLLPIVSK
ncbi:uncharacterized protein kiaa1958 [Aplochiton taeniatus]